MLKDYKRLKLKDAIIIENVDGETIITKTHYDEYTGEFKRNLKYNINEKDIQNEINSITQEISKLSAYLDDLNEAIIDVQTVTPKAKKK